jgi:hypothetical protein
MPLFGGAAHGVWAEHPENPCKEFERGGDKYTIHCVRPPNFSQVFFFAATEDALRTIRADDIVFRYENKYAP